MNELLIKKPIIVFFIDINVNFFEKIDGRFGILEKIDGQKIDGRFGTKIFVFSHFEKIDGHVKKIDGRFGILQKIDGQKIDGRWETKKYYAKYVIFFIK